MGGCLRRFGCLALLIVVAIAAYLTRAYWLPHLWHGSSRDSTAAAAGAPQWQSLTPDGAKRAREALQRLSSGSGPAFANVAAGDLAAYIMQELSRTLPQSADSVQAAAIGDRLYVRAVVRTADLGGKGGLGPMGALLGDKERLQLGGTLRIVSPGSAELRVREFKVRDFTIPQALIPRLVQQMSRGPRPAGLSPDGLPLKTPAYIGDVRVADGRITLYRTAR